MTYIPAPASAAESFSLSAAANSAAAAPRIWALVPCAGSGSRAGTATPKQYQPVAGKPLVWHTLAAFAQVRAIASVLVVVAPDDDFFANQPSNTSQNTIATLIISNYGGRTRANSVLNGLQHLLTLGAASGDWVLVHDAARCLVTPAQISALIDACLPDSVGGLLALKLADTLKSESAGRVQGTVARDGKWLAQTPQMFRIGPLTVALAAAGDAVTDESSAIEMMGFNPKLVPGSAQNFKVTYPEDFALAEAVLAARASAHAMDRATPDGRPDPASYDYP